MDKKLFLDCVICLRGEGKSIKESILLMKDPDFAIYYLNNPLANIIGDLRIFNEREIKLISRKLRIKNNDKLQKAPMV